MPLSALVDGEVVCAPLMQAQQWAALKRRVVTLTCGHNGFARISGLGTQHFAHTRGSDCQHAESAEHLHVKAVVAAAAAAAGWQVETEARGEAFVADVLASQADSRVALEVQRSRQVLHEYERRQARYAQAGIRCVWLSAEAPSGYQAGPHLPLFQVRQWVAEPEVVVAGRAVPLPDFVAALLGGHCTWRELVAADRQSAEIWRLLCPMCGRGREVLSSRVFAGTCGCGLPVVHDQRKSFLPERGVCCGYWGPSMVLGRRTQAGSGLRDIPAGHWCLSA